MGGLRQGYTGILDCLRKVADNEGVSALWQGTFTSIILALNPAIQLGVYEALKRNHMILGAIEDTIGNGGKSFGPFVNSFLAKFIATVLTYPIQVLQTRYRAGIHNINGTATSQKHIVRQLYRGFEAKVLQTCLNSGIMFFAYEWLVGVLTNLFIEKDEAS
jgi:adenine nucleotide transporter 17